MSYTRWQTTWRNDPSGATPAPAAFFQYIEDNNVSVDSRISTLEAGGGGGTGAVSSVAGRTGAVTLTKTDVGLINVDNTSDVSKPVSTLQNTAITSGDALAIPKSLATTKGDILGASASSVIQRLPVGTNGQVLTANSSATLGVDWETPTGGSGISPTILTTKGDTIIASGSSTPVRLPVGTNGQVLTANSGTSLGVDWETPISPSSSTGIVIPVRVTNPSKGQMFLDIAHDNPVDGITLVTGDRVWYQHDGIHGDSGIYVVQSSGALIRSTDMAVGSIWPSGMSIFIKEGLSKGNHNYIISNTNGSSTFTIATFPSGDILTAIDVPSAIPPGYTTINRNGGSGSDRDMFIVPANNNVSYYFIDVSTIPSGEQGIISVKDPTDTTKQTEINICVKQGTSSRPWDLSPSTIAWKNGMSPSTSIFNQSSLFDFTINTLTMIKLTWMGTGFGYVGEITTSIPPMFVPLANIPTSWTMTGGVTPWNGIDNQSIITPIYFMRNTPVAVQAWMYNEVCHYCSAAMRTRLANNNYAIEYGARFNCDGPRGSIYDRGGLEWAFGYSGGSPIGGFISLGGADSENSSTAALRGVIAHEMSHGVSANYYGGANPLPGPSIGNGSEPALMSQHSTLVTLQNDCINNGNGSTFSDEWFAELLRGIRVGDNGVLQPTATGSPLAAVGSLTNAGPGGTGGTPQNRADRFVTYINSLSLV